MRLLKLLMQRVTKVWSFVESTMGKNTSLVLGYAHESYVRKHINSGRFTCVSEAMRAGTDTLIERDPAVNHCF